MAGGNREPSSDLIQELLNSAEQFEFFQAVRLIERAVGEQDRASRISRIGGDGGPAAEPVRFRAMASLSFPSGQISRIDPGVSSQETPARDAGDRRLPIPLEMTVPFLGLTGPNGVLPAHYTSLLIERSHLRNKDHALREFFDLFNHRVISLF